MTESKKPKQTESSNSVSRRDFIKATSALGIASAVPGLILPGSVQAATPKRGGRLRLGLAHGSTADTLDPAIVNNGYLQNLAYSFANCLTEIGADGNLVPELAESYEFGADAKTWTFRLRKGIEFHNGKSLTADDVVASINYHRGEKSTSEAKILVDPITDITAVDASTVKFTLNAPNADFPFLMADHHLMILPSEGGKIDWTHHIGTGPYKIQSFDPGVSTFALRNENYWKEGRAFFDEVEWLTIIDPAARQNSLLTDQVDVIDQVPVTTLDLLARRGNIRVLEIEGMLHYTFPMRMSTPPFDNNDVRMALKLAVDRKQLVEKILRGHGSLGNDHPISPFHRFYSADLEQRSYDPDKAKWHVKQAGLEKLSVSLHAADAAFTGAVDTATIISENAKQAGIEIKVVREPNDGYWANVWRKKPWSVSYWGGRPTEGWMFSSAYSSTASANESEFNNQRFDNVLTEALATTDEAKRKELYHEAQLLVRDQGGSLIPMFANHIHGLSPKLQHPEMVAGNWQLDGHRATERWWFS